MLSIEPKKPRKICICMYSCITAAHECKPIKLPPVSMIKRQVNRIIDTVALAFFGVLRARYFDYATESSSNRGDIALRQQIQRLLEAEFGSEIEWLEIAWRDLTDEIVQSINDRCDAFVIGGGAYFHLGSAGSSAQSRPRFFQDEDHLKKITVPRFALAVGFDTLSLPNHHLSDKLDPKFSENLQRFARQFTSLSVRDAQSRQLLEESGIKTLPTVVPDPVLYSATQSVSPTNDGVVRIGLNLPFASFETQDLLHSAFRHIVTAMQEITSRHNAKIIYFLHESPEQIIPHWLKMSGVEISQIINSTPTEMVSAYQNLTVHVGTMMHSCIFAMSQNVPTVSLAYGTKSRALFSLLGLPELVLDFSRLDPRSLVDLINHCIEHRNSISQKIEFRRRELRPLLDTEISKIASAIRENREQKSKT